MARTTNWPKKYLSEIEAGSVGDAGISVLASAPAAPGLH